MQRITPSNTSSAKNPSTVIPKWAKPMVASLLATGVLSAGAITKPGRELMDNAQVEIRNQAKQLFAPEPDTLPIINPEDAHYQAANLESLSDEREQTTAVDISWKEALKIDQSPEYQNWLEELGIKHQPLTQADYAKYVDDLANNGHRVPLKRATITRKDGKLSVEFLQRLFEEYKKLEEMISKQAKNQQPIYLSLGSFVSDSRLCPEPPPNVNFSNPEMIVAQLLDEGKKLPLEARLQRLVNRFSAVGNILKQHAQILLENESGRATLAKT